MYKTMCQHAKIMKYVNLLTVKTNTNDGGCV